MDKINQYRSIIKKALETYLSSVGTNTDEADSVDLQLLFDDIHNHYQVLMVGWENHKRVYAPIFHLDIKDGKIWVQQNVSDYDLIQQIMDMGVPQTDIVLAFQSSLLRQFSGFAVA
ncbi:MAG: XisI protein [Bacteroidota bacterium]